MWFYGERKVIKSLGWIYGQTGSKNMAKFKECFKTENIEFVNAMNYRKRIKFNITTTLIDPNPNIKAEQLYQVQIEDKYAKQVI